MRNLHLPIIVSCFAGRKKMIKSSSKANFVSRCTYIDVRYFFYWRPFIFPIKKHFQFCNNGITDVFHFPNVIMVPCKNGGKFGVYALKWQHKKSTDFNLVMGIFLTFWIHVSIKKVYRSLRYTFFRSFCNLK